MPRCTFPPTRCDVLNISNATVYCDELVAYCVRAKPREISFTNCTLRNMHELTKLNCDKISLCAMRFTIIEWFYISRVTSSRWSFDNCVPSNFLLRSIKSHITEITYGPNYSLTQWFFGKRLRYLDVSANFNLTDGDCRVFKMLPLEFLNIGLCPLLTDTICKYLPSTLRTFIASYTRLTEVGLCKIIPQLTHLEIAECSVNYDIAEAIACSGITALNISGCIYLDDFDLQVISQCDTLQYLDISCTNLSDVGVQSLIGSCIKKILATDTCISQDICRWLPICFLINSVDQKAA